MKREFILGKGERAAELRERAGRVITKLGLDHAWRVEVSEYKPKRSDQQNRYLWGCVYAEVAKHYEGWRLETIHEYFLGRHFGWEEIPTMDGVDRKPIRRSSRLNKQEFADYIAHVQELCAEQGIFMPDPELP